MATTAPFHFVHSSPRRRVPVAAPAWRAALHLLICAGMPLGVFGLVQMGAEAVGVMPLYFTPFGLPGWAGSFAHIIELVLLGTAYWAVTERAPHASARYWLVTLTAAYIVLPFITPFLDSLMLAMICTAVLLLAVATIARVGAIAPLAGWLLAPMLALVGLSAAMGLAVAAYAPPFALMQSEPPPPPAI